MFFSTVQAMSIGVIINRPSFFTIELGNREINPEFYVS